MATVSWLELASFNFESDITTTAGVCSCEVLVVWTSGKAVAALEVTLVVAPVDRSLFDKLLAADCHRQ